MTEYGLAGLAFFICFYMAFFMRGWRTLSYGIPLMFLMAGGFLIGYWFEQLSVVVLFECMMLLDKKEGGRRV